MQIKIKKGFPKENYSKLLKWFQDLDVVRYIVFGKKVSKFNKISDIEKFFEKNKDTKYFRVYTFKNILIGYICLYDIIPKKECGIGIIIGEKEYWGKGFGREAMIQVMKYAIENLGIKKIVLTVCDLHEKAKKSYEKLGFETTKHIKGDREVFVNEKWIRAGTYHMELLKDNFE